MQRSKRRSTPPPGKNRRKMNWRTLLAIHVTSACKTCAACFTRSARGLSTSPRRHRLVCKAFCWFRAPTLCMSPVTTYMSRAFCTAAEPDTADEGVWDADKDSASDLDMYVYPFVYDVNDKLDASTRRENHPCFYNASGPFLRWPHALAHEFSCGPSIFKERSTLHVAFASASMVLGVAQVPLIGRSCRVPLWCFRMCFWGYVCFVRRILFVLPVPLEALFSQNDHPTVPQQLQAVAEG